MVEQTEVFQCLDKLLRSHNGSAATSKRRKGKVVVSGDSLIGMLHTSLVDFFGADRLFVGGGRVEEVLKQYATTPEEAPEVLIANFNLMHKMWHLSLAEWTQEIKVIARRGALLAEQATNATGGKRFVRMWLSAPALVSEREEHVTYERAKRFNAAAREALQRRATGEDVLPPPLS
eukprot:g719.t1